MTKIEYIKSSLEDAKLRKALFLLTLLNILIILLRLFLLLGKVFNEYDYPNDYTYGNIKNFII